MFDINIVSPKSFVLKTDSAIDIASHIQSYSAKNIFIVSDKGIVKAGLLDSIIDALKNSDYRIEVFDEVSADPSAYIIEKAATKAKSVQADIVIGVGGGSSLDVAKLVAVLANPHNSLTLDDMYGTNAFNDARLPLVLLPTTAGTGSETTPIAIVTKNDDTKMGIVSPILLPDIALLDPRLTITMPPRITAETGIDAMVHAIEAYTSKIRKNPVSDMYAKEALQYLSANIENAVQDGNDLQAREAMLLGASLAGKAFANAPVGGIHALAYPLGGLFHISHGLSNAIMLPHVIRFNAESCHELYAELAEIILDEDLSGLDSKQAASKLVEYLEKLLKNLALPASLKQCDIPESALPILAESAMQQQRLLVNNPKEINQETALTLYQTAYLS